MDLGDRKPAVSVLIAGAYIFDPVRGGLFTRDGEPRTLRPKAYKLLAFLVQQPDRMLDRAELMQAIWPGVHVTDDSLTHLVREVRRALDDPDGSLLRTVPGRGYRFLATVSRPEAAVAPAVAEVATRQHVTTFIGRRRELDELSELANTHRLLTITGMGGIGKTRLLQHFASEHLDAGTDPPPDQLSAHLHWIDLAPATTMPEIGSAISSGLGIGLPVGPAAQAIVTVLRHRSCRLLVDNAEHLVEHLAPLLEAILAQCREVSLILTSRVSLGIAGERVYRLEPLPLPPPNACTTVEDAMRFDAVRLFVDRVQLVVPSFRLEDAKPAVVGEICRRLDGIALAIEMAVPRMQVLTAEQFLQRLDQRFQLLTGRNSGGHIRHRSLRHMLEWSWELLWEPDRKLLTVLAVFTGTVSLPAIVAMRPVEQFAEWAVLEGLTELVRASLVIAEPVSAEPRFRLLETTRAFALEQLSAAEAFELRRQHLTVMVAIFEAAERDWPTASSASWLARIAPETDNLRAALNWAFGAGGEVELGLRLAAASYPFWWELPNLPLRESRFWFDLAVGRIGPSTPLLVQARLWLGHSWRDITAGDSQNSASACRAVELSRGEGDAVLLGAALWRQACSMMLQSTMVEAGQVMDEAIGLLRSGPPSKWLALALVRRASIHANLDEFQDALALNNEAFAMAERMDHALTLQHAGSGLAELMFRSGAQAEALLLLQRVRSEMPGAIRLPLVSIMATQLAAGGQREAALEAIGEVLSGAFETGLISSMARAIETLCMIVAEAGEVRAAARMLGYVLTQHQTHRRRTGGRSVVFNRLDKLLTAGLEPQLLQDLLLEGATWSEVEAVDVATLHYGWLTATLPGQRWMRDGNAQGDDRQIA